MKTAIAHLEKVDPVMGRIIAQSDEYKRDFDAGIDVYFALLESIVSQQISVKAADSIFKKFCTLFEDGYPHAKKLIDLETETLRTAGLSFQKIGYMKNVAEFHVTHGIDFEKLAEMTDQEIIDYLIVIKGVGKWTVEMLLMFVMARPDVFPIDDLVVRQNMVKAYDLKEEGKELRKKLTEIAEVWRPYRTTACRYIWRFKGWA